jgi:FkbM family methyltransferase
MTCIVYIMDTYSTPYGKVSLYQNEVYIGNPFKYGSYWDIDTLEKLHNYIDPHRNILEIGGHCGTSTLVYVSFLKHKKVYVYEPQKNMYDLLVRNIEQNNLQSKVIPYNKGVFCYEGVGKMNNIDIDGGEGVVSKRYNEENTLPCNFGGIGLGTDGEPVQLTTIDAMKLDDIGYIHCDAQGAENFIFAGGLNTIRRCRPVIYYENNEDFGKNMYDSVCSSYPQYTAESKFNIKQFCMNELGYTYFIDKFNGGIDTLLLP